MTYIGWYRQQPPPASLGVEWYEDLEPFLTEKAGQAIARLAQQYQQRSTKEAIDMDTISKGDLVLVEVHGLPGDNVKAFTYRATYDVKVGQQVQVPAPEWSIGVTGREYLPGFVLGTGTDDVTGEIREIIPVRPVPEGVDALLADWESQMRVYEQEADRLYREAEDALDRAHAIRSNIDSVKHALGGH